MSKKIAIDQGGWPLLKANLLVTLGMLLFSFSLPILEILADDFSVTALVVIRNILSGGDTQYPFWWVSIGAGVDG